MFWNMFDRIVGRVLVTILVLFTQAANLLKGGQGR